MAQREDEMLPPSGWYPDPVGRYELRHWDGRAWTGYVSDKGRTYGDPLRPIALPGGWLALVSMLSWIIAQSMFLFAHLVAAGHPVEGLGMATAWMTGCMFWVAGAGALAVATGLAANSWRRRRVGGLFLVGLVFAAVAQVVGLVWGTVASFSA